MTKYWFCSSSPWTYATSSPLIRWKEVGITFVESNNRSVEDPLMTEIIGSPRQLEKDILVKNPFWGLNLNSWNAYSVECRVP